MKKTLLILSICILVICSITIISNNNIKIAHGANTTGPNDPSDPIDPEGIPTSITLLSNKIEILNDGTDSITLRVEVKDDAGNNISNAGVKYYQGTTMLSSNVFATTTAGTYTLTAKIGDLTSNAITINVRASSKAWDSTKAKYINSANKLLTSADKIISKVSSSTLSTDSKNLINGKINQEKTAITTFKTNLSSELPPTDPAARKTQLVTSIRNFKANLGTFNKKYSYVKTMGKLYNYCTQMQYLANTSTMPTDIKETMVGKYQTKKTEIQTYSNTLINNEVNDAYKTDFKNKLGALKTAIKTIDTELKLRIASATYQSILTIATNYFNALTNCTNTSLKDKINTSLTAIQAQLTELNSLINDPTKYKDAKKKGGEINRNLNKILKDIQKLEPTCTTS